MAKHKVEICGIHTANLKVLKPKEMKTLFMTYQKSKDESIKEELILGNMKLVLSLIQKYSHRSDNMDDLFQVGIIGLIKAIENFDLNQNVQFSTYAVPMILGEVKRYLRDNHYMRISRSLRDIAYKVLKEKENYQTLYQKEPGIEELSKRLDLSIPLIHEALQALQPACSIFDEVNSNEGSKLCLLDQIPNKKDDIQDMKNHLDLHHAFSLLEDKERFVIQNRYYEGKTQMELADELFISQAQVSRIEKQALKQLHKLLR